jgi:hypothetical protein
VAGFVYAACFVALHGRPSLDQSNQDRHNGKQKQQVNESTEHELRDHAEEPKDDEKNGNGN